jgi:hypothetical protein
MSLEKVLKSRVPRDIAELLAESSGVDLFK